MAHLPGLPGILLLLFREAGRRMASRYYMHQVTALAVSKGKDLQLEKAVEETLKLLEKEPWPAVKNPPYSTPAKRK